jgi:hypothetical protein
MFNVASKILFKREIPAQIDFLEAFFSSHSILFNKIPSLTIDREG